MCKYEVTQFIAFMLSGCNVHMIPNGIINSDTTATMIQKPTELSERWTKLPLQLYEKWIKFQ